MIPLYGGFQMRARKASQPGPLSWRARDSSCRVPESLCTYGDSRIQSPEPPGKGLVLRGSAEVHDQTLFLSSFLRANCGVVASAGSMVIRLHTKALHTKDHHVAAVAQSVRQNLRSPSRGEVYAHGAGERFRQNPQVDRSVDREPRFRVPESALVPTDIVRRARDLREGARPLENARLATGSDGTTWARKHSPQALPLRGRKAHPVGKHRVRRA